MNKIFSRKRILAALGLGAVLAAGPAAAGIHWTHPTTLFEDNNIDAAYSWDGTNLTVDNDGTLGVGDILIAVLEIDKAGGVSVLPDELSGISAIQVDSIIPGLPGFGTITFKPFEGGLNTVLSQLGTTGVTVGTDGDAGGGAMAALWLASGSDVNLDIASDSITAGTQSCSTLADCIDQATDGALWEVDGFAGDDDDENWVAVNAALDLTIPPATDPSIELGAINGAVSILQNHTGHLLGENSVSCFPFCGTGAGADGLVDLVIGGSVKGGSDLPQSLLDDGVVATSDFDFTKAPIPEPGALALMSLGLLGMGAVQRRRRKA